MLTFVGWSAMETIASLSFWQPTKKMRRANAANEVAVDAFLDGRIGWLQIAEVNDATLQQHDGAALASVDDVLAADSTARRIALGIVESFAHTPGTVSA